MRLNGWPRTKAMSERTCAGRSSPATNPSPTALVLGELCGQTRRYSVPKLHRCRNVHEHGACWSIQRLFVAVGTTVSIDCAGGHWHDARTLPALPASLGPTTGADDVRDACTVGQADTDSDPPLATTACMALRRRVHDRVRTLRSGAQCFTSSGTNCADTNGCADSPQRNFVCGSVSLPRQRIDMSTCRCSVQPRQQTRSVQLHLSQGSGDGLDCVGRDGYAESPVVTV